MSCYRTTVVLMFEPYRIN